MEARYNHPAQEPMQIWRDAITGQMQALLKGLEADGRLVCEVRSNVKP